jgi:hypothetical protein
MQNNIITIVAVFAVGLCCGAFIVWLNSRQRSRKQETADQSAPQPVVQPAAPAFRLSFVIVPIVLAALCLIVALCFYPSLQSPIAYRFGASGEIKSNMNTVAFVMVMGAAQIIGALIAWGTASVIIKMGHSAFKTSAQQFKLDGFISLMSNMILLPQIIAAYLMLDAFIYNVWQRHFISATYFTIATIIIGSGIIFVVFVRLLLQARSAVNKQ